MVKVFLLMMLMILHVQCPAGEGKIHYQLLPVLGVRCVAMSCGGDSFSPDGAYGFLGTPSSR